MSGTNLTPSQKEALNRAIAEFEDTREIYTNYTRSLDAIVPVVQRWCEKQADRFFTMSNYSIQSDSDIRCESDIFDEHWDGEKVLAKKGIAETLPLALCLAFAQAAGIEWEGSDAVS